jgi:hypothetical protein
MHHLGSGWMFFHATRWSVRAPLRSAERIKAVYCQTKIKPKYIYDKAPTNFFPDEEEFQIKILEKIKTHISYQTFPKIKPYVKSLQKFW